MPASSGDFYNEFYEWTGHHGAESGDSGNRVGGWNEWRDVFHSMDYDFDNLSASEEKQMFGDFLVAFYPSDQGLTKDEWEELRYDFFADWDVSGGIDDFDWEAWREAMGY